MMLKGSALDVLRNAQKGNLNGRLTQQRGIHLVSLVCDYVLVSPV